MIIRAILWDLGGVLVRTVDTTGRQDWEGRLGLEPGSLAALVFESELGWKAQRGLADVQAVWRAIGQRFELPDQEVSRLKEDFWRGDELNRDLLEFIRNNRDQVKMGLLSNAWIRLRHRLEQEWQIADLFDTIIISAEHGITKPDHEIYQLALASLGVGPAQCAFVDDQAQNVNAAQELGLQAIHFQTTRGTLDELRRALGSG